MRAVYLLLVILLAACGPSAAAKRAQTLIDAGDYAGAAELAAAELERTPDDGDLWRVRIRAALGQHDARAAVAHYQAWRARRGGDDDAAMRMMALTTLWQALESPSAAARVAAIQAVERLEIEQLADAVADRLGDDDDLAAAAAAVAVLKAYPQAPDVAIAMLRSPDGAARAIAVEGIGRKVGARAADDLRPLATDPDPRVRRAVVRALGAIGDAADTERLVALATDEDAEVRAAALRALNGRGDHGAVGRAAMGDPHLGVRIAALGLLARDALIPVLTGEDRVLALHAAREVARSMPVEAAAALDRALGDGDWTVRAGALNAATAIVGKDGARTRAEQALADPELDVRLAAARVLGDDPRAIAALVEGLAGPSAVGAAIDLARAGDPRGIEALDRLVTADDPGVRRAAAGAYAQARRASIGAVLALADDSPLVRIAAAEAILDVVP